jgi:hypothetical protein
MNLAPVTPDYVQAVARGMHERDLAEFAAVMPTDDQDALSHLLRDRYGRRAGMLCACDAAGEPVAIGGAVIKRHYFPSLAAEGVHRIECVSMAGYGDMHRWLETLGMQREGLFRAYGKRREDFVQYAWVSDVRPTGT